MADDANEHNDATGGAVRAKRRMSPNADARKLKLLVSALQTRELTYEDLAAVRDLQLSRRSLQLYLERHLPEAGYSPIRGRTAGPRPRATFSLAPDASMGADAVGAVNRAAIALARGVLEDLFPIAGTDVDRRIGKSRVLAIASGVPCFEEHHMRALMRWITAAERDAPTPVMLRYRAARDDADAPAGVGDVARPRLVWPLGVILRDGRRVYLPALVEPAESFADRRLFALERVVRGDGDPGVFGATGDITAPTAMLREARPRLGEFVQPHFGVVRPGHGDECVEVHVRFAQRQAAYIRGRRWHPRQQERATRDGGVELKFGPVETREAVGWCSQWIDGVTVLGDAKLRRAYEASLEARLRVQRSSR